jgi:hypothetical protein
MNRISASALANRGTLVTVAMVRSSVRAAERGLVAARGAASHVLDSLQLRLRAIEVSRDPSVRLWAAEMRQMVESGEIERRLEAQPEDPRVLIDRRRAQAS